MRLEKYLSRFYVTYVCEGDDIFEGEDGQINYEIYESRDDIEPIGWFVSLPGRVELEWRNIYGKVVTGTMYTEAAAKAAAKARAF